MEPILRILIPTWNNPQYLNPCVESILRTGILNDIARLTIINNGKQPMDGFKKVHGIDVIETGENLGWEGGLKAGMDASTEPFICFQNDDTFIPASSSRIYQRMLMHFGDKTVGAVGPVTTTAGGIQSIFHPNTPVILVETPFLIFFTVMVRREAVESVGGVDITLPGGDDLDMSIRLRKAGYRLIVDPGAFLIHHGFKTGTRVHGDGYAGVKNGWNSPEMTERTNMALIRKHGFTTYTRLMLGATPYGATPQGDDPEGGIVIHYTKGENVLELGCGGKKTVPNAVGVDRIPNGEEIPHLSVKSVADVVADVQNELPFDDFTHDTVISRHILEHCLDTIKTLQYWNRVLKMDGHLVIAVPDENVTTGIPLNIEHCHAFTRESLKGLAEACGFVEVESKSANNGVSFVGCFKKVKHMASKREAVLV